MSQRLIVGLEEAADWRAIKTQLVAHGADWMRDPSPEQPDVIVVTIPDEQSADQFLRDSKRIRGVRYVERDAMRSTF